MEDIFILQSLLIINSILVVDLNLMVLLVVLRMNFFYLDVSKPFKTTDSDPIPWIDLTFTGGPLKTDATACIGGKNNDIIFIFGGISKFDDLNAYQSFVNQFDTNKQQWINITSVGNVPTNRFDISCANFDNGLIAIFSGNGLNITNDLWIFNTLTLTWNLNNAINAPLPMSGYCAVTLSDGNILYIGESSARKSAVYMSMNYSTLGPPPPSRQLFSAVLSFI
ncbi:hypothetical protein C2G38_2033443 [Gigaspora rosea]|uniref:Galactose oxidase n=1 Tax=Gigaspora rosea TaxID=44941 RepID=A0A397VKV5_9GLOM|nr:hypothetical protein C2G38_2033443 [Gigaspora rosea]